MLHSFPDPAAGSTLLVGQDTHGHWLVQELDGEMEGSFVSRDAAVQFARWEKQAYARAKVELAPGPLVPRLFRRPAM